MIGPVDTFINEAHEHLQSLEEALLELEDNRQNADLIDQAFRAMHTIKGAGGMFGYKELSEFTHHLETALDKIRDGHIEITSELISVFLDAKDHITHLLPQPEVNSQQQLASKSLLDRLYQLIPSEQSLPLAQQELAETHFLSEKSDRLYAYRIRFTPNPETLTFGFDVFPLLRELHSLGECHVTTLLDNLPDVSTYLPEHIYLSWDITLLANSDQNAISDVFIFVEDDWDITIQEIDLNDTEAISDKLGELLIERNLLTPDQLNSALAQHKEVGHILREEGLVSESQIQAALIEQEATRNAKVQMQAEAGDATIRVPAKRLDKLMNLVGELVIVQARMNQIAHLRDDEDIRSISEELDLLTTEMRDNTFSIRMLPIGTTFGRFKRLVRDTSRELNKNIVLQTSGGDTELDKMMIDKLADPLVHLIRNSMDHGIETSADREQKGKAKYGTISLSAEHAESQVLIKIKDDGRGLDTEAIRKKAIQRNLLQENSEFNDQQLFQIIFEPGFSTASKVTDISGRGVGMDVVKRSIQDLGGKISINSKIDEGTEVTISLPMTLAIIEGLMIHIADESYVLPLNVVEECIEINTQHQAANDRRRLVQIRGELVPYMRLREWFGVTGNRPAIEQVVVVRIGEERFGFCVDEVIGQYQTVIKRLGKMYENTEGFSGATILGDGSVAIILDPLALREAIQNERQKLEKAG